MINQTSRKGRVGIEVLKGRLRVRMPRTIGERCWIATGLDDTPINRKKVEAVAADIEISILAGTFELSEVKQKIAALKVKPNLTIVKPQSLSLLDIWSLYTDYRKPSLAVTTYLKEYQIRVVSWIKELPTQSLDDAIAIRDHIKNNNSTDTAKRMLDYLNAACKWAVSSKLIKENPFDGIYDDIKRFKHTVEEIDPFSKEERDIIIKRFEEVKPFWANWVKFLFWTGCRPSEAVALRWKDIKPDCSVITFAESYNERFKIRKDTKTHVTRKFPCSNKVKNLLLSIRTEDTDEMDSVFTSPDGGLVNVSRFCNQVWHGITMGKKTYKGLVSELVKEGLVERYRPPYACRHTFITEAIAAGLPITSIAKIVGNSPQVILSHYAGNQAPSKLPDF